MKRIALAYWKVLGRLKFRTGSAVATLGLAGLLEGTALMFLVPILGQGISATPSGDYGPLPRVVGEMMRSIDYGKISLFLAFMTAGILSAMTKLLAQKLTVQLRTDIEESLRRETGQVLFNVDWTHFLMLRLGHTGKAVITETSQAADGCQGVIQLSGLFLASVCLVGFSFMISPQMTAMTFLFGAVTAGAYYIVGRRALRHAQSWWSATAAIAEKISELFNNLKYIRGSGVTNGAIQSTEQDYHDYNRSYYRSVIYKDALRAGLECAAIVLMAGFLAYGFFWSGHRPEWAIVFLAIFYRLMPRISAIQEGLYMTGIYGVWLANALDRIELLRAQPEPRPGGDLLKSFQSLALRQTAYRYPSTDRDVFQPVSFEIKKGETLLLSGDSGSGKTTLMDLILGLLRPTGGTVLINGRPLPELDINAWRNRVGLVLQGSPVFHGSVLENISFFSRSVDEQKAWRCAEMADAASFIREMPSGMRTPIGEKGSRLSGGQRQRIALARALYRDPWLLLLDEPTSELDAESQQRVIDVLRRLKPNFAIILSSHRGEVMALADRVLKLPLAEWGSAS